MRYRKIGNSELKGSVVSLGTWVFGGDCWGEAHDEQSIKTVRAAVDSGVNLIDTAPIYGGGRSERVIGKALKSLKRDDFIIATKCGLEKAGNSIRPNLTPSFIREEIENSLKRLNVETIDLYQCHWPDPGTAYEKSFSELNKLVEEGKIRYIGVSNFTVEQIKKAAEFSNIISNQLQYSMFDRTIESDMIPYCEGNGISILSYGSLGGGILTGKYTEPPQLPKGDVREFFYRFYKEPFWSRGREFVSVLENIAEGHNTPVSNVAINWVLNCEQVSSCITGCRNSAQLEKNISAAGWELNPHEITLIQQRYNELFSE
jgi:aryl-alcohol dehydrogenase-like predicted oxidoreductase